MNADDIKQLEDLWIDYIERKPTTKRWIKRNGQVERQKPTTKRWMRNGQVERQKPTDCSSDQMEEIDGQYFFSKKRIIFAQVGDGFSQKIGPKKM